MGRGELAYEIGDFLREAGTISSTSPSNITLVKPISTPHPVSFVCLFLFSFFFLFSAGNQQGRMHYGSVSWE